MVDKIDIERMIKLVDAELTDLTTPGEREDILGEFRAVLELDLEVLVGSNTQKFLDYETKEVIDLIRGGDLSALRNHLRSSRMIAEIDLYDREVHRLVWDVRMEEQKRRERAEIILGKVRESADELEGMGFKLDADVSWKISEIVSDCGYILYGKVCSVRTGRELKRRNLPFDWYKKYKKSK